MKAKLLFAEVSQENAQNIISSKVVIYSLTHLEKELVFVCCIVTDLVTKTIDAEVLSENTVVCLDCILCRQHSGVCRKNDPLRICVHPCSRIPMDFSNEINEKFGFSMLEKDVAK